MATLAEQSQILFGDGKIRQEAMAAGKRVEKNIGKEKFAGSRVEQALAGQMELQQSVAEQAAAEMRQKVAASTGQVLTPWPAESFAAYLVHTNPSQYLVDTEPPKSEHMVRSTADRMQLTISGRGSAASMKALMGHNLFAAAFSLLTSSQYPECPKGHALIKFKEGLRWHQGWVHTRACDNCGKHILREEPRWRCAKNCKCDLCCECYKKSAQKILRETSARPSKLTLQVALTMGVTAEVRDTREFDMAAQALMQLYCSDIRLAAASRDPAQFTLALHSTLDALQGETIRMNVDLISALNDTLNGTLEALVEALKLAIVAWWGAGTCFLGKMLEFDRSANSFGLHGGALGLSRIAASALSTVPELSAVHKAFATKVAAKVAASASPQNVANERKMFHHQPPPLMASRSRSTVSSGQRSRRQVDVKPEEK